MFSISEVDGQEDEELLRELQRITLPFDSPYPTEAGHWWLARDGERAIGFAGLVESTSVSNAGYLCRSGVLTSYRGKGLQKRLIRVREMKARRMDWRWMVTDTADNPPSANNLISCGYRLFKPNMPWGLSNSLYWRKRL